MKPASPTPVWSTGEKAGLVLVLLAAALPRLYQLETQPVWCDEGYFWRMATHPGWIQTLLHTMVDDVYPPLYFLLIHAISLATASMFWLRLPGALAGTALAGALYFSMRSWAGGRAALFAGLLVAVSPVLVYYCQEMKMYSILALLLWLLAAETLACLDDPQRGWKRIALWATLAVYTFYLALVLWICLLALSAWRLRKDLSRGRPIWKGYAAAALIFVPWVPFFLKSVVVGRPGVLGMLMDRVLFFSLQNSSEGFWAPPILRYLALAVFASAVALGFWRTLPLQRGRLGFLLGVACLPLLALWIPSLLGRPLYSDRAMLVCTAAWIALAAFGLSRLPTAMAWVGLVLLMGLNMAALGSYYTDPLSRRPDQKQAWDYVTSHWQVGDSIFHQASTDTYYPFKFYSLQEARLPDSPYHDEPGAAFQAGSARLPGVRPNWIYQEVQDFNPKPSANLFRQVWRRINAWLGEHGMGIYAGFNRDAVNAARAQSEALPGVKRIWYLNWTPEASRRNWMTQMNGYASGFSTWSAFDVKKMPWMDQRFRLADQQQEGDVTVYLLEAKPVKEKKP
jgi:mannosyltransferase